MNVCLQDSATKFYEAPTRLYMKIGYEVHDFYAGDIYYNNSCYIKFILKKIEQTVMRLLNYLMMIYWNRFFCAKEKNRT